MFYETPKYIKEISLYPGILLITLLRSIIELMVVPNCLGNCKYLFKAKSILTSKDKGKLFISTFFPIFYGLSPRLIHTDIENMNLLLLLF